MYWLPSVDRVPCIDALSQRSHYVRVNEGGGGGGGGGGGPSGGPAQGNRVDNPNWDPRFKPTTALGLKIKKMKMKVIMDKANFDKALCAPCDNRRLSNWRNNYRTGCGHKRLGNVIHVGIGSG